LRARKKRTYAFDLEERNVSVVKYIIGCVIVIFVLGANVCACYGKVPGPVCCVLEASIFFSDVGVVVAVLKQPSGFLYILGGQYSIPGNGSVNLISVRFRFDERKVVAP
jgi:hypothetical protein